MKLQTEIGLNYLYSAHRPEFTKILQKMFSKTCPIDLLNDNNKTIDVLSVHIVNTFEISLEEFKIMADSGANIIDHKNYYFLTFCGYKNAEVVDYFIKQYGFDINDNYDKYIDKFKYNGIGILKLFLDHGIKIDSKIIHYCQNDSQKIKLLIEYGADINLVLKECMCAGVDTLELLIQSIDNNNNTFDSDILCKLLYNYVSSRNDLKIDLIRILINLGADPLYQNIYTRRSIIDILCSKDVDELDLIAILKYFHNYSGSNFNICNQSIALGWAILRKKMVLSRYLLDSGTKITDDCILNAIDSGVEYVNLLIQYGISDTKIAEIYISDTTNILVAKLLVNNGINFNNLISNL